MRNTAKPNTVKRPRPNQRHPIVGTWAEREPSIWVSAPNGKKFSGTWEEEQNPVYTSSAVFTISVSNGEFVVAGVDESDGTAFEIADVHWDGEALRFTSIFPPTEHRAMHAFRLIGRGRVRHEVTYTEFETWRKRRGKPKPKRTRKRA